MTKIQSEARNKYILASKMANDFDGMVEEQISYHKELLTECLELIREYNSVMF